MSETKELHGWRVVQGIECVECPRCGFTFDAGHENEAGGYTCPNCAPDESAEADDLLRKLILQVCDAAVLQAGFPDDAPEPDRSIIGRRREIAENVAGYALEVEPPPALVELRKLIAAPVPAREGEEPDLLEAAMQGVLVAEALEGLYEQLKMSAKGRKAFSAEMAQIMAELEPTRTAIDAARLREGGGE